MDRSIALRGVLQEALKTKKVALEIKSVPFGTEPTGTVEEVPKHLLSDEDVAELLERAQADALTKGLTAPRLTLFNGQEVSISVGTPQSHKLPLLNRPGQETEARILNGVTLDVKATVSADRRNTVTNLRVSLGRLDGRGITRIPAAARLLDGVKRIGRHPVITEAGAETTMLIPDSKTAILRLRPATRSRLVGAREVTDAKTGKKSFETVKERLEDVKQPRELIYLLVKPKIIVRREEVGEERRISVEDDL